MAIREATTRGCGADSGHVAARTAPAPPGPAPRAVPHRRPRAVADTEAALTRLYRHAGGRASDAITWYLANKRGKRSWSRGLRLAAIVLVTAGALASSACRRAGCAP